MMTTLLSQAKPPIITGKRTCVMERAEDEDGIYFYIIVDIDKYALRQNCLVFLPNQLVLVDKEDKGESLTEVKLNWGLFQTSDIPIEKFIPIFESLPQKTELELFAAFAKKLAGEAL